MPSSSPPDPESLQAFPRADPPVGPGKPDLFRIYSHRDPETGALREPFYFCSAEPMDPGGGRYDLPPPDGACYLALSPVGAWLEVFRGTMLVDARDVRARRLLATRPPYRIRTADLLAPEARGFGVTGELHASTDYVRTRAWAAGLFATGFRALLGKLRHDPALDERSLTLLDAAGPHPPYGWRWRQRVTPVLEDDVLLTAVESYGYRILEPPHTVPTEPPPVS